MYSMKAAASVRPLGLIYWGELKPSLRSAGVVHAIWNAFCK